MGKLIYSAITSLDEYGRGREGAFGWAAPGDELLAFVTRLELLEECRFQSGVIYLRYRVG